MSRPWANNNYSITVLWIMAVLSFAIGPDYAGAGPDNLLHYQTEVGVKQENTEIASVINSACEKILEGDFETARRIVGKSNISIVQIGN